MAIEVHVNDIGTVFEGTIYDQDNNIVDLSGATTKDIKFLKPDDIVLTKAAVFTTNGTDGKIQYTALSGDLDLSGTWKIQGFVVLPLGEWSTDIQEEFVYDNL